MSGPKSYSVKVFNKHLRQIFELRYELEMSIAELKEKKLTDDLRGISYENEAFIENGQKTLDGLLEMFKPSKLETLNQSQFNEFYNQLSETSQIMQVLKIAFDDELARFKSFESSYQVNLDLEIKVKEYEGNFETIKKQFLNHIRQTIPEASKYNKLVEQATKIRFDFAFPPFSEDFSVKADLIKTQMENTLEQSKKHLNSLISPQFSGNETLVGKGKVFLVSGKDDHHAAPGVKMENGEEILTKIRELLNGISDPKQAQIFKAKFADLLLKHKISENYFFTEFIGEIREAKIQEEYRVTLINLLNRLKAHHFEKNMLEKSAELKTKILSFLQHDRLKKEYCDNSVLALNNLIEKDKIVHKERLVHEEEIKYIKARTIAGLRDLNYEVMTDMEVIDFEKDDVFLLTVPNQENFINVRFDSEGKMLYNFLIPENRNELTHEQKETRLAEMDEICTEFKKMLGHLKSEGLNIDLKHEISSSEKALVQIPPKFKTWVKKSVSKKGKKNTLNNQRFLE